MIVDVAQAIENKRIEMPLQQSPAFLAELRKIVRGQMGDTTHVENMRAEKRIVQQWSCEAR